METLGISNQDPAVAARARGIIEIIDAALDLLETDDDMFIFAGDKVPTPPQQSGFR